MKWRAARVLIERGIVVAFQRGERVRFLTLTDGTPHGTMTVQQLSEAWDDLARLLRRGGPAPSRPSRGSGRAAQEQWRKQCKARRSFLSDYVVVLEVGTRGQRRWHAHVVYTGRYIPQRRLSAWARQCGFGRVVDVREVAAGNAEEIAAYAAKLAWYGAKAAEAVAKMKGRTVKRLRPIRPSRGWYPGGMRQVEADLGLRRRAKSDDPGPWVLIRHDGTGHIISTKQL